MPCFTIVFGTVTELCSDAKSSALLTNSDGKCRIRMFASIRRIWPEWKLVLINWFLLHECACVLCFSHISLRAVLDFASSSFVCGLDGVELIVEVLDVWLLYVVDSWYAVGFD